MAIQEIGNGGVIVTGQRDIQLVRLHTLESALKLEIKGLKRRGRSVYSIVKQEFGLKGNKQKVLEQFSKIVKERAESRNLAVMAETGENN
mgnify:CR=1 FL=1